MADQMSHPLDRSKPLWETHLVRGLPDGRWALIFKVHHAMVDGISGVGLLTVLLDLERDAELPEPQPWTPRAGAVGRRPGGRRRVGRAGGRRPPPRGPGPGCGRPRPLGALRSVTEGEGLLGMGRHLGTTPPLSIEDHRPRPGPAHSRRVPGRGEGRRPGRRGTVNDVVLASVSAGYRRCWPNGAGPDAAVLTTLVPVSVRGPGRTGCPTTGSPALLFELPVSIADPVERVHHVCAEMAALKRSHIPTPARRSRPSAPWRRRWSSARSAAGRPA